MLLVKSDNEAATPSIIFPELGIATTPLLFPNYQSCCLIQTPRRAVGQRSPLGKHSSLFPKQ